MKVGFIDLDIDECDLQVDQCHSVASCTNTRGSYQCTCPSGSAGDGFNCTGMAASNHIKQASDGLGVWYRFVQ